MLIGIPEVKVRDVLTGALAFRLEREVLRVVVVPVTCLHESRLVVEFLSFRVISKRLEWN